MKYILFLFILSNLYSSFRQITRNPKNFINTQNHNINIKNENEKEQEEYLKKLATLEYEYKNEKDIEEFWNKINNLENELKEPKEKNVYNFSIAFTIIINSILLALDKNEDIKTFLSNLINKLDSKYEELKIKFKGVIYKFKDQEQKEKFKVALKKLESEKVKSPEEAATKISKVIVDNEVKVENNTQSGMINVINYYKNLINTPLPSSSMQVIPSQNLKPSYLDSIKRNKSTVAGIFSATALGSALAYDYRKYRKLNKNESYLKGLWRRAKNLFR